MKAKLTKLILLLISSLIAITGYADIIFPVASAATPPKTQTITKIVKSAANPKPGVYWYQQDNGDFRADTNSGPVYASNAGDCDSPAPAITIISDNINFGNWLPSKFDAGADSYNKSVVSKIELQVVEFISDVTYKGVAIVSMNKTAGTAVIKTETGAGYIGEVTQYSTRPNGCPKVKILYYTPYHVSWTAEVYETKEIDVNPDSSLQAGSTKQLNASVRTKDFGATAFGSWVSVATNTTTTSWSSADPSIATVSSTGLVKGIKPGKVEIRATWRSGSYEISDTALITVSASDPGPDPSTPPDYSVTGDFDILPANTINWRDSFSLKPKNFVIPASCQYQYHQYRIVKDGSTWTSGKVTNQSTNTSYSFASYPTVLGVGANDISILVVANCADSGWTANKTLNVNSPTSNQPPQFSAGFFKEPNRSGILPDYEVVIGGKVNLRVIQDFTKTPAWPYDPDGDQITYTWQFSSSSSSWIQSFPDTYGAWEHDEQFSNLTASQLGYHSVKVIARDSFGAETSRYVGINVIPDNPIPIIEGPSQVKENHPLPKPIDGSKSYSPAGRAISDYLWVNKKDKYTTAGTETIKLDVVDSAGLKSLSPATHTLMVLPDEPPIPVLNVQPLGIRQTTYEAFNNSYSPDGDKIVSAAYRFRYDKDNNGFVDDSWNAMPGTLAKTTITPTKVGKYEIEVTVTEDYGKSASTSVVLDTTNLAPSVSFLMEGENEIPAPDNKKLYSATEIMSNWPLYQTNSTTGIANKGAGWSNNGNALSAGLGRMPERIRTYSLSYTQMGVDQYRTFTDPNQDSGYGANTLNGYRAMANGSVQMEPLLWQSTYSNPTKWDPLIFSSNTEFFLRTNKSNIYYTAVMGASSSGRLNLYAMNKSKIGKYQGKVVGSGYDLAYEHSYTESPMDFVIYRDSMLAMSPPVIKAGEWASHDAFRKRDQSQLIVNPSKQLSNNPKVLAYEVSDRTIYQIVTWDCNKCSKYRSNGYLYDIDQPLIDIRTYDAFTGEMIASTGLDGIDVSGEFDSASYVPSDMLFTKGDRLVYFNIQNEADKRLLMVTEFDRTGRVAKRVTTELPANFNTYGKFYRGPDGEWYGYEYFGSPTPAAVFKINSDYTLGWIVSLAGFQPTFNGSMAWVYGDRSDDFPVLLINPIRREVIARSYNLNGFGLDTFYQTINMDTGALSYYDLSNYGFTPYSSSVGVPWTGEYRKEPGYLSYTVDGYRTAVNMNKISIYDPSNTLIDTTPALNGSTLGLTWMSAMVTKNVTGGMYVGDGIYLALMTYSSAGYDANGVMVPFLIKGTPTSVAAPYQNEAYKLGQFVSTETMDNTELTWTMNVAQPTADQELAGMSFRMSNPKNRYAVEIDGSKLYLAKYINGTRTVLSNIALAIQPNTNYNFKTSMQGNRIQVYVNGVPYFDVTDNTFATGKFGPFSNKSYVDFSKIALVQLADSTVEWMTNFAIWDAGSATADVRITNQVFSDPENDPRAGNYQWSIQHTPKFLNNQGLSALHGQTLTSPTPSFDKVGNYRVTLRAQDDPHPNYLFPSDIFGAYRKYSNEYWQIITVHRRPIAQYSLSFAADKSVVWNDQSYDPDRWQNATTYSTEATGIDYKTTRGVLERKYYYVTPSGTKVNAKLVTPQETGTYTVALQVKDEYGAWSFWSEQQLAVDTPVVSDDPPTPGFTLSKTTLYRGEPLTIVSTAKDKEDGAAANLKHDYYIRNVTAGASETLQSTSRGTWSKSFNSLGVMDIRQVVCDSKNQCAQLTKQVTVLNRLPKADFDWSPKPVWEGDSVAIASASEDPDGDMLIYAWTISGPDGYKLSGDTANMSIPGSGTAGHPGIYRVTLTVKDPSEATDTITKNIVVHELGIQGMVRHTDAWEANRLRYNDKHPEAPRPPDWFWAGEAFVLEAAVTDTGDSDTHPVSVEAAASPDLRKMLMAADPDGINWKGVLRSEDAGKPLDKLPQGPLTFTFTVTYSNGVKKKADVTIQVKDTIDDYFQVHRVQ